MTVTHCVSTEWGIIYVYVRLVSLDQERSAQVRGIEVLHG